MRTPDSLTALVDHGIIESVQRPLMSGKEAHIYLVSAGGAPCVAKIYKEAQNRSFQNRADYIEGRKVRNSRDQRAMGNRSKHGRAQNEAAWKSAEVDMIYRLRHAGVRVPTPYNFIDGVLLMELVTDAEGFPAPRLGDLTFEPAEATEVFHKLLAEVVRMLCAGVVHGDLSDFNVLMDAEGPVIIDFPQAVDASSNANARKLLLRDVENLQRFHAKFVPDAPVLPYAQEMWDLYSRNALTPDTRLTGKFRTKDKAVSTQAVLDLIADAERDERRRREGLGLSMRGAGPADPGTARSDAPRTSRDEATPSRGEPKGAHARVARDQAQHAASRSTPTSDGRPTRDDRPSAGTREAPVREPSARGDRPRFAARDERQSVGTREAPAREPATRDDRPRFVARDDRQSAGRREAPAREPMARDDRPRFVARDERQSAGTREAPGREPVSRGDRPRFVARDDRQSAGTREAPGREPVSRDDRPRFVARDERQGAGTRDASVREPSARDDRPRFVARDERQGAGMREAPVREPPARDDRPRFGARDDRQSVGARDAPSREPSPRGERPSFATRDDRPSDGAREAPGREPPRGERPSFGARVSVWGDVSQREPARGSHRVVESSLRQPARGHIAQRGHMGDKSPKAKNKNKQQGDASKQKKAADAREKQAPKTTSYK